LLSGQMYILFIVTIANKYCYKIRLMNLKTCPTYGTGKILYNRKQHYTIDKVTEKQYSDEATFWREVFRQK